jgi:propanol-preferring alcohol dehydrogenase
MKAAVLEAANTPLVITEREIPPPEAGQILIKVKACGVCHTDLHLMAGEWRLPKLPLILGHEVVGAIESIGGQVSNFKPGDRVGVPWIYSACGVCEYCTSEREALCPGIVVTGYMVDGGYAEYLVASASYAVAVPEPLSFVDAAPLYCAGLTPYRALKISGVKVGETVAIWGVGGLGHYAVQIARAMGTRVIAVDIQAAKLDLARQLGADVVIDASKEKAEKAIRALGGAHIAVCLASSGEVIAKGFEGLRRGGTLVLVGLPPGTFTLPILGSVAKGIRILTSAVGSRQDLRELLGLAASGKIHTVAETCRLDDINGVLDRMREGNISGRVVLEFP